MDKYRKNKPMTPGVSLKKPYKAGDSAKLQQKLWRAVEAAEAMLYADGVTYGDQIRAVHALVQAAASYARILETVDLEERIAALEQAMKPGKRRR